MAGFGFVDFVVDADEGVGFDCLFPPGPGVAVEGGVCEGVLREGGVGLSWSALVCRGWRGG